MKNVIIYKIGHDHLNWSHNYSEGIFKSILNSSDTTSPHHNPKNIYYSEFSTIEELLKLDIPYDYIGICHYRTLIGEVDLNKSYKDALKSSEDLILKSLEVNEGICSKSYPSKFNNQITRPRWVGSKSLEYLRIAIQNSYPELLTEFDNHLKSFDNSYRTVCVLPKKEFYNLFSKVMSLAPKLVDLRIADKSLYPRSVGYELETFTSFLLTKLSKELKIDRLKNTVVSI